MQHASNPLPSAHTLRRPVCSGMHFYTVFTYGSWMANVEQSSKSTTPDNSSTVTFRGDDARRLLTASLGDPNGARRAKEQNGVPQIPLLRRKLRVVKTCVRHEKHVKCTVLAPDAPQLCEAYLVMRRIAWVPRVCATCLKSAPQRTHVATSRMHPECARESYHK